MRYSEALRRIRNQSLTRGVVSGPQRSGTSICARALAHDLNFKFFDEGHLAGKKTTSFGKLERMLAERNRFVLQAPVWSRWLHELEAERLFVVWMLRDLDDILASQERIGWGEGSQLAFYGAEEGPVATVKLDFWREHQRDSIEHAFEIDYESLSGHPLWVPKEHRR